MRLRTLEDVRKALEQRHGPIPDEVWEELERSGDAEAALINEEDLDYVEDRLLRLLRLVGMAERRRKPSAPRHPKEEKVPPDQRLLALSEILALQAARRPDVQAFRREVLGNRLIPIEEIPAWVRSRAEQGGQWVRLVTVTVAVPPDAIPKPLTTESLAPVVQRFVQSGAIVGFGPLSLPTLAFPSGDAVERIPIAHGGTLWRLKQLAEALQRAYRGWDEAQAVALVLSGATPLLPRATVGLSWNKATGSRIQLDVDARMSSAEVARIYGRWRSFVFRGADMPIEEKARHLAVFGEQHRDSGKTWRELMALWNQQHPQWAFHVPAHFAANVARAWQQVTGEKWPGKKGGRRRGKEARSR